MDVHLIIQPMARRKTITDDELCDRLLPVLTRHGPEGLTFALAGEAVALVPGTLVQRFGNREGMIAAILTRAWDRLDAATAAADQAAPDGPEGACALLSALTPGEAAEVDVTDGLRLLREDFRNPALRARGRAWGETLAAALGRRLHPEAETGLRLGWQMLQVWQGALIWWAFTRQGEAREYLAAAVADWCRTTGLTRS
jgi:AcrR family transcriptional regulator